MVERGFARAIGARSLRWLAAAAALLAGHNVALAQSPNFAGQRITVVVGTTTGGSFDFYARLVSRHIGRFLAGNPSSVVTNMPGAGGVIEANWLYNVAPKDGTAIGIVPLSAAFEPLLGSGGPKFDARRFAWLASLNDYVGSATVWAQAPFETAQDMMAREIIIGGGGSGSDITIWPNLLKSLVGLKIKLVTGYIGTTNVYLAMERGEVQGMMGQDWDGVKTGKSDWLRDHKIRVPVQIALARAPDLPDTPTALELAKTPEDREVLELFIARQKYSRPFAAPPGLSEPVIAALRAAFAEMAKDTDFIADAATSRLPLVYAPGEEINARAEAIYASPPALIERAKQELAKANQ